MNKNSWKSKKFISISFFVFSTISAKSQLEERAVICQYGTILIYEICRSANGPKNVKSKKLISISFFQHVNSILNDPSFDERERTDKSAVATEEAERIFEENFDAGIGEFRRNRAGIGHLFLVGGFAESPLVQEEVRSEFKDKVEVIIPQVRSKKSPKTYL